MAAPEAESPVRTLPQTASPPTQVASTSADLSRHSCTICDMDQPAGTTLSPSSHKVFVLPWRSDSEVRHLTISKPSNSFCLVHPLPQLFGSQANCRFLTHSTPRVLWLVTSLFPRLPPSEHAQPLHCVHLLSVPASLRAFRLLEGSHHVSSFVFPGP